MKTFDRYFTLLSLTSLLTGSLVWAQSPSSSNPSAESKNANATAGVPPSTDPTANPHASDSTGKSQSPGSARASREIQRGDAGANPIIPQASANDIASGADATATVRAIQTQPIESQKQLVNEIEQRTDIAARQVRRDARSSSDPATKTAYDRVQQAEQQLKRSLRNARNATADTWDSARASLAADYAAFATAVSTVEAASANNLNTPAVPRDHKTSSDRTVPPGSSMTPERDSPTPRNP